MSQQRQHQRQRARRQRPGQRIANAQRHHRENCTDAARGRADVQRARHLDAIQRLVELPQHDQRSNQHQLAHRHRRDQRDHAAAAEQAARHGARDRDEQSTHREDCEQGIAQLDTRLRTITRHAHQQHVAVSQPGQRNRNRDERVRRGHVPEALHAEPSREQHELQRLQPDHREIAAQERRGGPRQLPRQHDFGVHHCSAQQQMTGRRRQRTYEIGEEGFLHPVAFGRIGFDPCTIWDARTSTPSTARPAIPCVKM